MKSLIILSLILTSILCTELKIQAQNRGGVAVVELFTSEGCSSCPPADEAVTEIAGEYKDNVYILGFHVDYWDRLGWKDAFSDASYSNRQQHYAHYLGLTSIYTPKVIVNGNTEFVGSNKIQLHHVINEELEKNDPINIALQAKTEDNKTANLEYRIVRASGNILNIAIVQLHGQTEVKGGENGGKQLRHINIVREFKTIDISNETGNISLPLPKGLPLKDLRIIVYLQDKNNWHIKGAAETDIVYSSNSQHS
jgi:hypothetical protein